MNPSSVVPSRVNQLYNSVNQKHCRYDPASYNGGPACSPRQQPTDTLYEELLRLNSQARTWKTHKARCHNSVQAGA